MIMHFGMRAPMTLRAKALIYWYYFVFLTNHNWR